MKPVAGRAQRGRNSGIAEHIGKRTMDRAGFCAKNAGGRGGFEKLHAQKVCGKRTGRLGNEGGEGPDVDAHQMGGPRGEKISLPTPVGQGEGGKV